MSTPRAARASDSGFAMAALLIMLSVMSIGLSMLLPAWGTLAKREREEELVFRGNQYARAVAMYQRSRGAFPPSVDVLVNEKFLRKKYKDPMTEDGEFQIISVGTPIPGQATPPSVPGRGRAAGGRGSVGTGLTGGLSGGRGTQQSAGRGTGPTLGSGIGAGTPAAASGFNRVTRPGMGVSGPVLGVVSKSEETSLRLFNGRNKYNEWAFVATEASQQAGGGGAATPGGRGTQRPGMEGRGRGLQSPGMGGRGMPRGSGAAPLQLPGLGGRGRGGSPFTVP